MRGGQELDARGNLDLVADRHRRAVEDDGAVVDEAARAEADRESVVALERRPDLSALAEAAEQLAQNGEPLLPLRDARRVEALDEQARALVRGHQLRVGGEVELASEHPLLLRPHSARS